jgi:hypothetical protein
MPTAPSDQPVAIGDVRVSGHAVVYRLYDIGYGIRLDAALDVLRASAPERVRLVRGEAAALQITNPPVSVILGTERLTIAGAVQDVEVSARIFDFGVISLRLRIEAPAGLTWAAFSDFGRALNEDATLTHVFGEHLRLLRERVHPAVDRPALAPITEDYIVYRIGRITGADGRALGPQALGDVDVAPLLLNETRPLSEGARRELLPHRFSYYTDDLAILTWDNALVAEPGPEDADVQYILEFANAQLLELRYYDDLLDRELRTVYERVTQSRGGGLLRLLTRRYAGLLSDLQRIVADSTEIVERVENSLKVTDDVYLARIYNAAIEIFRGRAWRSGIDRKLAIVRETYAMLNAEAQAARAEALEISIVALIVLEIVLSFWKR